MSAFFYPFLSPTPTHMFFSSHDQLLRFLVVRLDIFCQPSTHKKLITNPQSDFTCDIELVWLPLLQTQLRPLAP